MSIFYERREQHFRQLKNIAENYAVQLDLNKKILPKHLEEALETEAARLRNQYKHWTEPEHSDWDKLRNYYRNLEKQSQIRFEKVMTQPQIDTFGKLIANAADVYRDAYYARRLIVEHEIGEREDLPPPKNEDERLERLYAEARKAARVKNLHKAMEIFDRPWATWVSVGDAPKKKLLPRYVDYLKLRIRIIGEQLERTPTARQFLKELDQMAKIVGNTDVAKSRILRPHHLRAAKAWATGAERFINRSKTLSPLGRSRIRTLLTFAKEYAQPYDDKQLLERIAALQIKLKAVPEM